MMYHEKVMVIHAFDHFSSDCSAAEMCIAEFVGILYEENEFYIKLRHILADINRADSGEEFHYIMKSAIYRKWEFELTQENEMSSKSD